MVSPNILPSGVSLQQLYNGATASVDKLLGRSQPTWSTPVWKTYSYALSQAGFVVSLPMTVLSFLAIPFFGGTGTSINLVFFYLTWSAFIWTHSARTIEIYGTLAVRILVFLLPALGFLTFDYLVPGSSASIKAGGKRQLPAKLGQQKLLHVTGWAIFNVFLAVAVQTALELVLTEVFGTRPTLRVTMAVPLPWTMAKELIKAFVARGILHYVIHRYVLHASVRTSPPARWHRDWAHSNRIIFSLASAYDHPVCYLLAYWIPSFLPALYWRMHVLTWLLFQVIVSLESLFIYSGYSALPSGIMLPGMARRIDKHFMTGGKGNFGHWGILDLVCGTRCAGDNLLDDLQDEAAKHQIGRRTSQAVDDAGDVWGSFKDKVKGRRSQRNDEASEMESEIEDDNDYAEEVPVPRKKSRSSADILPTKRRTRQG